METIDAKRRGSESGLFGMISESVLRDIAERLMKATRINFFVIDFKGENVTGTSPYQYYKDTGRDKWTDKLRMVYALAAAKSAIQNSPYLFQSHKGFLNMVIPVIVNEQYIGAVAGGPVRLNGEIGSEDIDDLSTDFEGRGFTIRDSEVMEEYTADQFRAVADLTFFIVQTMSENARSSLSVDIYEREKRELDSLKQRNEELKARIEDLEYAQAVDNIPGQVITNFLTIASSFSVLEDAKKTENILYHFSSFIRYYLNRHDETAVIADELSNVSDILQIVSEQYGRTMEYRISCDPELKNTRIPVFSILPLVLAMINCLINQGDGTGTIYIDVENKENLCQITLQLEDDKKKCFLEGSDQAGNEIHRLTDNIKKRLEHICGSPGRVRIIENVIHIEFPNNQHDR